MAGWKSWVGFSSPICHSICCGQEHPCGSNSQSINKKSLPLVRTRQQARWQEEAGKWLQREQALKGSLQEASVRWQELFDLSKFSVPRSHATTPNAFTGLSNFGNTCYLNVILQALVHCSAFRAVVIDMQCDAGSLEYCLQCLVQQCLSCQWHSLVPLSTLHAFVTAAPSFHDAGQHDAAEAFGVLLDTLTPLQTKCRTMAPSS